MLSVLETSSGAAICRSMMPGAVPDPLVGGLDQLLEVGVGHDVLGEVVAEAGDAGADQAGSVARAPSCVLQPIIPSGGPSRIRDQPRDEATLLE